MVSIWFIYGYLTWFVYGESMDMVDIPPGYVKIAIENDHRNSGFSR